MNRGREEIERDKAIPCRSNAGLWDGGVDKTAKKVTLNNNLTCIYVNARSIMNKLLWLEAVIEATSPDIVGITESWSHDGILEAELELAGYNLYREDRKGGMKGGGVLLYVRSELRSVFFKSNSIGEHVCCRLLSENNNDLVVGIAYRSDNLGLNMDTNESARQLIRELQPHNFLLMGDFNYPDIDWENNEGGDLTRGCFLSV